MLLEIDNEELLPMLGSKEHALDAKISEALT